MRSQQGIKSSHLNSQWFLNKNLYTEQIWYDWYDGYYSDKIYTRLRNDWDKILYLKKNEIYVKYMSAHFNNSELWI